MFSPVIEKNKPRKLLEQWEKSHGTSPAFEKLKAASLFYGSMADMLNGLLIGQESDICRASQKNYASGAVRLMTLHGSKGLEFPVVFLAGVSKGALPLERKDEMTDTEEERRLFFVGITRAREELILSASDIPSCFMDELPKEIIIKRLPANKKVLQGEQLSFF